MAAGDTGSPARYYSSTAVETSLQSSIAAQSQGASNTSFIVASISGFPTSYPYTLIVDPDTSKEEVLTVTSGSSTTLTVTRGADNTQAVAHSAGAVVRHGVSARDFRESENHIAARGYDIDAAILDAANQTHVHGIATGDGVIVGTLKTQTLTNKTITTPTINGATITGTVTATTATFTSPTISGSPVITGLSSAGMVDSSATPKNYVDAILGSATAAATSAASAAASATAAATSATSAANSATAAATSATSADSAASIAIAQASSASSSASAAATSATSASTSATSAAASATAAATSATSAAASATSAEAAWDSFDDRYLGPKASPPTVDNDGNPLTAGVIYYNTGDGNMYVWNSTSSSWQVFTTSGDITSVTAGTGLTGGGTTGAVTVALDTSSVYVVPTQTGQSGKYLTTNGTAASWATVDALPSQTGNSGKYLTTNGTTASWSTIVTDPTPSIFMLMGA